MSRLPILGYRYVVSYDRVAHEFRLRRNAVRFARNRLRTQAAEYHLDRGEGDGPPLTLHEVSKRIAAFLGAKRIGRRITATAQFEGAVVERVRCETVALYLRPVDTQGVPNIDLVVGAVMEFWPHPRWAGICVCKPSSDHRDCAAVDWFDAWESMRAAVGYFLDHADQYGITYIILGDVIYSRIVDFAPRPYTGHYHSHVHVSVEGGIPGAACD